MKFNILFVLLVNTLFYITLAAQQPGSLDFGFGTGGMVALDPTGSFNNTFYDMAVQPDGKIIVAGIAAPKAILMRLNADGTYDTGFGNNGIGLFHFEQDVTDGSKFTDVALRPDGKIMAATFSGKDFVNYQSAGLARFNVDGTLDNSYGQGGYVDIITGADLERVNDLALQPDGKTVVVLGALGRKLTCFDEDGNLDSGFGQGGFQTVPSFLTNIALQADGKIVLGGHLARASNPQIDDFALTRYLADGNIDMSFGTNGVVVTEIFPAASSSVRDLTILPDGKILAVGSNGVVVAKYSPDGALDTGFGNGGFIATTVPNYPAGFAISVVAQPDGKIVVGVNTHSAPKDFVLVRLLENGQFDQGFGQGGIVANVTSKQDNLMKVALMPNGKILAGGHDLTQEFVLASYHSGLSVGTADISFSNPHLLVYPNPATDYLNFQLRSQAAHTSGYFKILDAVGRTVYTSSVQYFQPSEIFMIPAWNLAPGVYFLQYVRDMDGIIISEKFVKL